MKTFLFTLALFAVSVAAQAATDTRYLRDDILKMIALATSDYLDRRGPVLEDDATHTVYHVSPPYDHFLTSYIEEQYITTDKSSGHALFSKAYRDMDASDIIMTFASFANVESTASGYLGSDPRGYTVHSAMVRQPGGDFADTLRYKGIAVAVLFANAEKTLAVITIGIIHDEDRAAAAAAGLPVPRERPWPATKVSEHLTVSGSVITVKGWGPDFDGAYDVANITRVDSCLSGDCSNGHGRKVLAFISASGQPRIRIMDGRFTHDIFTGDGVMLIDGEGPEVAGT